MALNYAINNPDLENKVKLRKQFPELDVSQIPSNQVNTLLANTQTPSPAQNKLMPPIIAANSAQSPITPPVLTPPTALSDNAIPMQNAINATSAQPKFLTLPNGETKADMGNGNFVQGVMSKNKGTMSFINMDGLPTSSASPQPQITPRQSLTLQQPFTANQIQDLMNTALDKSGKSMESASGYRAWKAAQHLLPTLLNSNDQSAQRQLQASSQDINQNQFEQTQANQQKQIAANLANEQQKSTLKTYADLLKEQNAQELNLKKLNTPTPEKWRPVTLTLPDGTQQTVAANEAGDYKPMQMTPQSQLQQAIDLAQKQIDQLPENSEERRQAIIRLQKIKARQANLG